MKTNLSELICTRFNHDIIGNVGAVANAVELLEEGDMDFLDDIKSILKTSSTVLSARLKFFRLAFGLQNPTLDDIEKVRNISQAYLSTVGGKNPPQLEFDNINPIHHRGAMLTIMTLADLLIKGGTIKVCSQSGKTVISIQNDVAVSAEKSQQVCNVLQNTAENLTAQDAPLLSLLEFCHKNSIVIKYTTSPSFQIVLE